MKPADWTAADDDAAWAEIRDSLCPECEGEGRIAGGMCYQGNYWEPPEFEELVCPVCDGQGILAALAESLLLPPDLVGSARQAGSGYDRPH